ncbi:PH domain-containing protein [Rheinheimera texasensis]|uniref:PH domain-containing protein n=1 Tax=Rheinheimera texasensis TaxID=306205 RepID=UPI0004E1AE52|nr:PH domain-containing protein [Rheinheimera texasensis]
MLPEAMLQTSAWQRVSAWALLPLLGKSAWEFFGFILGGAVLSSRDKYAAYMPYALALLALLIVARALVAWRCSRFRVTAQGIELEKGLLHKEKLLLPQARVQELQVKQPFYFRPLALYAASLDSAGSKKQEFALTGLSEAQLMLLQGHATNTPASASTPFHRIWLATLYNAYLWLPLAAVFGMSQQFRDAQVIDRLSDASKALLQQYDIQHNLLLQLLSVLMLLALIALVLTLMCLIWLYPQHFQRDARKLQLTQGAVLKKSLRISAQRVQLVLVNQPWLARLFGHYSLIFRGFAADKQQGKFVVLGQTAAELDKQLQAQQLLPLPEIQGADLQKFVPAYFRRQALWSGLGVLLVMALIWQSNIPPLWLKAAVSVGLSCWWLLETWLNYRWHGYRVQDDVIYLWQGGLSRRWYMLPLQQVQQVRLQQTPFFQQHQMVNVQLHTANGKLTLAAIPNAAARQLYEQVLALQYVEPGSTLS